MRSTALAFHQNQPKLSLQAAHFPGGMLGSCLVPSSLSSRQLQLAFRRVLLPPQPADDLREATSPVGWSCRIIAQRTLRRSSDGGIRGSGRIGPGSAGSSGAGCGARRGIGR